MSRPMYENGTTLEEERRMMKWVSREWGLGIEKMSMAYVLDCVLLDDANQAVGFVELKRRHITFNQYPDIFLALHKVDAASRYYTATGLPSYFVAWCDDALVYCDILKRRWIYGRDGRTDRNDPHDLEPCARIPLEFFQNLKGSNPYGLRTKRGETQGDNQAVQNGGAV